MISEFPKVIGHLWASLGLPQPEFLPTGSIACVLDGSKVELTPSSDGANIVVTAPVGPLSENPVTMADQVRRLLMTNAAYLAVNRACACLDRDLDPPVVIVRAIAPCDIDKLDQLAGAINDASDLAIVHERELAGTGRAVRSVAPPRLTLGSAAEEDMVIFEP